jgi:hypothetical protein
MPFSRRAVLTGAAAFVVSSSTHLSAQSAAASPRLGTRTPISRPGEAFDALDPPLVAAHPSEPRLVLDPQGWIRKPLLEDALRGLERHRSAVTVQDRIYLVDFARHSSEHRLFSLDLSSGEVRRFRTAHGKGSDPSHTGFAQKFSNTPNSLASSVGAYVTAGPSAGPRHGPNVLLEGLEPTNSKARERAIIVHAADYAEPGYLRREGKLGRSYGCFSVCGADLGDLRPAMGEGRLLFAGV